MVLRNMTGVLVWALAVLVGSVVGSVAQAHELQANRATLVLRDRQHLAVTFFVDYVAVLHQALAPQQPERDFVLLHAAMKPQEFQSQLQTAQRALQAGVKLSLHKGKVAQFGQWVWPAPAAVHSLLQQRAMQAVVAPAEHAHAVPTEIRVEFKSANSADFASVVLQLPAPFKDVLLVYYQPKQVWLKPGAVSSAIVF